MEDASVRTYILLGARSMEFALKWVGGWIKDNTSTPGVMAQAKDLAPAHVNCVRLYLAPVGEAEHDDVLGALKHEARHYNLDVRHDDYTTYGAP